MQNNKLKPYVKPRFKLIVCAVLARECYSCAAQVENIVDIQIVEQGQHDVGQEKMSARLQKEIDSVDTQKYDAILLGYGLCNNGTVGLKANIPLIIPKAHDCITLLLGSKERYQNCIKKNTATFFYSSGWLEQYEDYNSNPDSTTVLMGLGDYDDYVQKYGEENAKFLQEQLGGGLNSYDKFTFIDTGVGNQILLKEHSKKNARENGWKYEELQGNTSLLLKMMNGNWSDEEFLIVKPGKTIQPSYDKDIICCL